MRQIVRNFPVMLGALLVLAFIAIEDWQERAGWSYRAVIFLGLGFLSFLILLFLGFLYVSALYIFDGVDPRSDVWTASLWVIHNPAISIPGLVVMILWAWFSINRLQAEG